MQQEQVHMVSNTPVEGDYFLLELASRVVAPLVQPGQFVHVRIPGRNDLVLRRPFSVFRAGDGLLSILYKRVGEGTQSLSELPADAALDILGPLGRGFPPVNPEKLPVLVAGGYGMAALYLVAERAPKKGVVMVGGATGKDILCVADFERIGWEVRVATEDGSRGTRGRVTEVMDAYVAGMEGAAPEFFACGPMGMLKAVAERAIGGSWTAWISLDRNMGCGVGACLACVQKVRDESDGPTWARICKEGPVFECREVIWE